MSRQPHFLIIMSIIPLLILSACLPGSEITTEAKNEQISEKLLLEFMDEPEYHFKKSLEALLAGDLNSAATEIRKATAFIELVSDGATDSSEELLAASIKELHSFDARLYSSEIVPEYELKNGFARALQALALHHDDMAAQALESQDIERSGHELKAAASDFSRSITWANTSPDENVGSKIPQSLEVATQMIDGVGYDEELATQTIQDLGEEIEDFLQAIILVQ